MTYVPPLSLDAVTAEDLVLEELESRLDDYGVHTIYVGPKSTSGHETGKTAVVCVVERKGLHAQRQLPPSVTVRGQRVLLDVIEAPQPKDLRLRIDPFSVQAVTTHQKCHDTPIPGGAQIAPANANWVGTLGCALNLPQGRGFLTNEHVSGLGAVGASCCQPHGRAGWFGKFLATGGVRFDGPNYIDAAVGLAQYTDGQFAPGTYTVTNKQLDMGQIKPEAAQAQVGLRVVKSGRTTGVTRGRIVGINATSRVGYDEGTALYRGQVVIQSDSGNFSAGGDSGSLILTEDLRPVALLFAGGGGQTIANPIGYVLDWCKGSFF